MLEDRGVIENKAFEDRTFPFDLASTPSPFQHGDKRRVIFVTNRGPIEHHFAEDGTPVAQCGAGGVVSGLLCAARGRPVSWISVAMTDADRALARPSGDAVVAASCGMEDLTARLVYIPAKTFSRYYDSVSNRLLWFAQHGLSHAHIAASPTIRQHWERGYVAVNRALADAVLVDLDASGGGDTPIMFHDYHLYLAPKMVRDRAPNVRMQHFIHIPWPAPEEWASAPDDMVRAIYEGLIANDVIGLQTRRDVAHFLAGVRRHLPEACVSRDDATVWWEGRQIAVRAYPIALTKEAVEEDANAPEALEQVEHIREQFHLDGGRKLIVRVDRVEPAKNIVRGFQAYERMLGLHPELRGRVTMLALLVPSRESLPEYRRYAARVREVIEAINARFGTDDWQPVVALFGNDRARALACMRHYDVLLVNSLADGMNLVVKEGVLLNRRNGVLVLSERAGAYGQLERGALGIAPKDVAATADALYTALEMPTADRIALAQAARAALEEETASRWLSRQLKDLLAVTNRRRERHEQREEAEKAETPMLALDRLLHEERAAVRVRLPDREQRHAHPVPAVPPGGPYRPSRRPLAVADLLNGDPLPLPLPNYDADPRDAAE